MDETELRRQREAADANMDDVLSRAAGLNINEMNENGNHSDIEVNEKDLAMLDGDDDNDLEKAFGEGELDDDDANLLAEFDKFGNDAGFGDADEADSDFDMIDVDDPNALEKLEALEKKKASGNKSGTKKTSETTKQPTQPPQAAKSAQPPPKSSTASGKPSSASNGPEKLNLDSKPSPPKSPVPTPSSTKSTSSVSVKQSKSKSQVTVPPSPSVSEAVLKERRAVFSRLERQLRQNIEDLSSQMKLLLLEKKDESTAKAQKYLKIKQARQKDLEYLLEQASIDAEVPIYKTMSLPLSMEVRDLTIEMDKFVVSLKALTLPGSFKGHFQLELELGAGLSATTGIVSGKKFISLDQQLTFSLPTNCRSLQSFVRPIRVAKLKIAAFSKGLLWSKEIASGEMKLTPLLNATSTSGEIKLCDGNKQKVADIEVEMKVSRPFAGKQIVTENKELIVIDKNLSVQHVYEEEEAYERNQQKYASTSIETTENTVPTTKSGGTQSQSQSQSQPKEASVEESKPVPQTPSIPQTGDALLKYLKCPETVTWEQVKLADSPAVMCSFDAMNAEKEACEAKLSSTPAKDRAGIVDRIETCNHRLTLFEVMVGNGSMTLEMYLSNLKDGIERDKNTLKSLILLAKHFISLKDTETASEYKQTATWLSKTVKMMESELKTAEENMDELEEE